MAVTNLFPNFHKNFFTEAVKSLDPETLPLTTGASVTNLLNTLTPVIFDPSVMPKRVNQAAGEDSSSPRHAIITMV